MKHTRRTPEPNELHTGGKTPELTLFFNIAYTKVLSMIHHWETGEVEKDPNKLDEKYQVNEAGYTVNEDATNTQHTFKPEVYAKLRNYLWKGYETDKNKSGFETTEDTIRIIGKLLNKLRELRNFHSHIWHKNDCLQFDKELCGFLHDKHEEAMDKTAMDYSREVEDYKKNFDLHPLYNFEADKVTKEGRAFFLSFFLTRREMQRLLQQLYGSKRNDELKYRVKHIIYRYYTHRDGAIRNRYNQEENILSGMPPGQQQEILATRQLYKIINYLNDIPDSANDPDTYPLYVEEDGERKRANTIKQLVKFCEANNILSALSFYNVVNRQSEEKEGLADIQWGGNENYSIRISQRTLHRLILDVIRKGNEEQIMERLNYFVKERNMLLDAIEGNAEMSSEMLNEYVLYRHRGDSPFRQLVSDWVFAKVHDLKKEAGLKAKLVKKIIIDPIEQRAAIELRYYDFYFEKEEKPRSENLFVEMVVKYIMDFKILPEWEWQVETFKPVEKTDVKEQRKKLVNTRYTNFKTEMPDSYRLSISEGGVLVRLRSLPQYKFLLGHHALRYLMIAHFDRQPIADFFAPIIHDLSKIKEQLDCTKAYTIADLSILKPAHLPRYMKLALGYEKTREKEADVDGRITARIDHIITQLRVALQNEASTNRNAKNKQIMDCYQLYDWQYKFLRRDEYQAMSIYHYSMELMHPREIKNDDTRKQKQLQKDETRRAGHETDRLATLIAPFAKRIPAEVKKMLKQSKDIHELYINVIEHTLTMLDGWRADIEAGHADTARLIQKLALPAPAPDVNDKNMAEWRESFRLLPFNIHPSLVLFNFYKKEMQAGSFFLSKKVWNEPAYTHGLRMEHYDYSPYIARLTEAEQKKTKSIGTCHDSLTEDALLWKIAAQYLQRVNPIVQHTLGQWRVANLSQTPMHIPVRIADLPQVEIELFFHQLDDILIAESRLTIERIVAYMHRSGTLPGAGADGVILLLYSDIDQQLDRIYHSSLDWVGYLLDWERSIVEHLPPALLPDSYLSFKKVCTHARLTDSQTRKLKEIRNCAFHTNIPVGWTYEEKMKDEWLYSFLNIMKKAPRNYEQNKAESKP